jgi:hypothetical protein
MVETDSRFSPINKPIGDTIFFFQTLFLLILQKWTILYPNDFLIEVFDDTHIHHFKNIIKDIEIQQNTSLNFPFILSFFKDALLLCRKNISSSLYQEIFASLLISTHHSVVHHPRSNKIAVIVDPRYDSLMQSVIINFMHFMNPHGWNLMILSYSGYRDQIIADFPTCIFSPIPPKYIVLDDLNNANMSVDSYNQLFLSKSFWESIPATHITIFQKDCIMYKMFDESLFLSYDFAGANYTHPFHEAYFSGGINGGFSVRNKDAMIDCIQSLSWDDIISYNKQMRSVDLGRNKKYAADSSYHLDTRNEDVFFTNACEILNKRLPDIVIRNRLAIESIDRNNDDSINTSVYHGWNKNYHEISTARILLEKSPLFFKFMYNVGD